MNINQMWRFPQNIHTPCFRSAFPCLRSAHMPSSSPRLVDSRLNSAPLGFSAAKSLLPSLAPPSTPPAFASASALHWAFRLSHFPTFFFPPLGPCFSAAKFPRLPSVGWSAFTFPPSAFPSSPLPTAFAPPVGRCVCLLFPLSSFSAFPFSTYTPSAHSFRYASAHSLRVSFGSAFAFCPLPLFFFRFASFPFIISFASLFSFT